MGIITDQTRIDVDYAEFVGCTSIDDRATSDTFPPFPLIMILLVGNVMLWLEVLGMAEPIQFCNCLQHYGEEVAR